MSEKEFTKGWVGRFRTLTLLLICSGALNIALFAALIVGWYETHRVGFDLSPLATSSQTLQPSNISYLSSLSQLHFRELVAQLTNRDVMEDGYLKRDLALAVLVANHFFYLEKALEGQAIQRRPVQLLDGRTLELYPGLSEEEFQAIVRYAYQEKWPFTPKGLFLLLKKGSAGCDLTLQQAFVLSPEFHAVRVLFQQSGAMVEEGLLVKMILEGEWDMLETFVAEEALQLNLSAERRREILLRYVARSSLTAATLLVRHDASCVLKQCEDRMALHWLALFPEKSEEGRSLALELLKSPRSDEVHRQSALFLFRYAGEEPSVPLSVMDARARFLSSVESKAVVKSALPKEASIKKRVHIVREGESLWKISRQYKVKLEELMSLNGLEQERLLPGMELFIPVDEKDGKSEVVVK